MNLEVFSTYIRKTRNTIRHMWEGVFGKTARTKAIEAAWQAQMGELFTADRITMTADVRAKHHTGREWIAHLQRTREKKLQERAAQK